MSERVEPRREGRIFVRGKKGILWVQWYDCDGKQQRETTGSTDPRKAESILRARLNAKEKGQRYAPKARRATVGDLIDGLLSHHETAGTKSLPRIRQCAAHLAEHFGREMRAGDVDYRSLESFVKARRRGDPQSRPPVKPAAPQTVRSELFVFAQAFKVASWSRCSRCSRRSRSRTCAR